MIVIVCLLAAPLPGIVFFVDNRGDGPQLWWKLRPSLAKQRRLEAAQVCFEIFSLAGVPACGA